jgi:Tfp pilus assembly protein PilZ
MHLQQFGCVILDFPKIRVKIYLNAADIILQLKCLLNLEFFKSGYSPITIYFNQKEQYRMARNEKQSMAPDPENRKNARSDEFRPISVKDLKAGISHKATMLNSSKDGLYFETDSLLQEGTQIYLGIENSSNALFADEFECKLAEIIWRKKLKRSFYAYGYGIKFMAAAKPKEKKGENQREGIEERKYPRKPSSKSLHYAANRQILKGTSKNISFSGILIKTENKLSVGQTIILSLPSKKKNSLQLRGEVVWSSPEGFGVKFVRKGEE